MPLSSVALLTAIVVGIVVFALGYFYRGFKGAQGNYKLVKNGLPTARKGYFAALWSLVKWGAGSVVLVAILVTWAVNGAADDNTPASSPSSSVSPSPGR